MLRRKGLKEKVQQAKHEQFTVDKKIHEDAMSKSWKNHTRQIEKIHTDYRKVIEKLEKLHNTDVKKAKKERVKNYEKTLKNKDRKIDNLKEEITVLKSKLKDYEEAYDIYRGLREHLVFMARKMKKSADKVKASGVEIFQAFSEMEDLSEFHIRKMRSIEPKIENKLFGVNEAEKQIELKIVKSRKA